MSECSRIFLFLFLLLFHSVVLVLYGTIKQKKKKKNPTKKTNIVLEVDIEIIDEIIVKNKNNAHVMFE